MVFRGCNGIPVPPVLSSARMWLIQGQQGPCGQRFLLLALHSGTQSSWSPLPWPQAPCLVQECSRSGRFNGSFWEDISYPLPPHPERVNSAFPALLASGTAGWLCHGGTMGEWGDGAIRYQHGLFCRSVCFAFACVCYGSPWAC